MAIDPDHVPSPCTRVCRIDERTGLCAGCRRTLDEIAGWGAMGPDQRRGVLASLEARPWPPRGLSALVDAALRSVS
jgi:predicted Fe-S protein YdhL (DUF1289 family)